MSLMTALNAATSGLRSTQVGIDVVAQNIANADSAGYTRRRAAPVQSLAGDRTSGVRSGAIERMLDGVAQRQMRLETSGSAYASLGARYATELDRLFGPPGGVNSLDGTLNGFTQALQGLSSDPSSYSARSAVLDAGAALGGRIASIADGVQVLRTEAESRIASAVSRANELLSSIAAINGKAVGPAAGENVAVLDERDRLITELSQLVDVQVVPGQNGSVSLMTAAGLTLFNGISAVKLNFDARAHLGPNALYAPDSGQRGVETITATSAQGTTIDVVGNQMIRSGEIAAALEWRDRTLVQAQRQLDELAGGLSRALSDRPASVTAASAGGFNGFTVDLAGLQAGNAVTIDYTVGGSARRILLVPTTGATPDPIAAGETNDPGAPIVRFPLSAPIDGSEATAIQTALTAAGIALSVTSPASGQLRILNSAAPTTLTGVSAGITETSLTGGRPTLPFFVDSGHGNTPFTGSFEGGSHLTGFAQRMAINPALLANRSRLVVSNTSPSTLQGDATRPQHLLDSLTRASRTFSAASGIGGVNAPYTSSVLEFGQRIVETQAANAEGAARLDEGQQVALAAVQGRYAESSGVNVDQEMALLVALQTAYGANARVMTAVRDMLDMLMRI